MIKKTLLLTCVLLSTFTAGAQKEVLSFEGNRITHIPGELTADGKARLCVHVKQSDGSELFHIYNTKMELETTLKAPTVTYSVTTKIETASVPGTSMWNYDISGAAWTTSSESTITLASSLKNVDDFYNMDTNVPMRDCDMYVTQTLFNNDEEWEFIFASGASSGSSSVSAVSYDYENKDNDKPVGVQRTTTTSQIRQTLEVYNQNGVKICAFENKKAGASSIGLDEVWIADGKKYISIHSNVSGNNNYTVYLVNDSGLTPVSPGAKTYMRGDADGDGKIGMPDVMYDVNYILNGKFPDE